MSRLHRLTRLALVAAVGLALIRVGASSVFAVTSIGTDISTDGTLTVAGNVTFDTNTLFVNASGNLVGIGNTAPANAFTIGTTSTFEVDPNGNLIKIRNVPYSWPSSQGSASTVLTNNGSGSLTWTAVSGSNLNQAYLAATGSAEISLTPSVGAVTIADTMSGTGNIFEIQNRTTAAGDYSTHYLTVSSTATSIAGALTATGNVTFDTNTFFLDAAGNSVGIGTTSPGTTLEVSGQTKLSSTSFPVFNILRYSSGDGTSIYGGMLLERGVSAASASNGNGFGVYFKAENNNQIRQYSGLLASGLDVVTSGSEIGFMGMKAAYQGSAPTGSAYGLKLVATSATVDNAIFSGNVGIQMTGTPGSELDLRDSSPTPTTNILQVANYNDSTRYLTVSSTSTSIQTGLDLEDGTGSVSTNAVTINATAGVITDTTDINTDATRTAITLTNSRITASSVVTATMCSTPDTNAMLVAAVTPGSGSATITVRNVGTGNQTATWKLCFLVMN